MFLLEFYPADQLYQIQYYDEKLQGFNMIFLVVSSPALQRPSEVIEQRKKFWPWAQKQKDSGY